jgi:hypothetical protein
MCLRSSLGASIFQGLFIAPGPGCPSIGTVQYRICFSALVKPQQFLNLASKEASIYDSMVGLKCPNEGIQGSSESLYISKVILNAPGLVFMA